MSIIPNDEPTARDELGREDYAAALARVAARCEPPMVIGLFGPWGVGKTSLMQWVRRSLGDEGVRTVWFDPWRHQFDEHPALALVHSLVRDLEQARTPKVRKLLTVIGAALGSGITSTLFNVGVDDIRKFGEQYEQDRFETAERRVQLKSYFDELIDEVCTGVERIVFFIDDLDRCLPETILSVLESLKLYLSHPRCVYFLAVDRQVLETSVRMHYRDQNVGEVDYLDKIVQLPFQIPEVARERMVDFVREKLPEELADARDELAGLLVEGIGRNPRSVKRFIRSLTLALQLVEVVEAERGTSLDRRLLTVVRMIDYGYPELWRRLQRDHGFLHRLVVDRESAAEELEEKPDENLERVLDSIRPLVREDTDLSLYFQLTHVASAEDGPELEDEAGFYTEDGIVDYVVRSQRMDDGEHPLETFLLRRSKLQRTWLVTSERHLYCLLDSASTRARDRLLQWRIPLAAAADVAARKNSKGSDVIDVGAKRGWLYSSREHPDPRRLEQEVAALVERARRGRSGG